MEKDIQPICGHPHGSPGTWPLSGGGWPWEYSFFIDKKRLGFTVLFKSSPSLAFRAKGNGPLEANFVPFPPKGLEKQERCFKLILKTVASLEENSLCWRTPKAMEIGKEGEGL